MAATALPRRGALTPKNVADWVDNLTPEAFKRVAEANLRHRGKIRTKGDRGKTLTDKTANIQRSDDLASLIATRVREGLEIMQAEYVDKIEDEEAEAVSTEVKDFVELHGADAVVAALAPFADDRGRIGRDFRITGAGFQRRRKKQRS